MKCNVFALYAIQYVCDTWYIQPLSFSWSCLFVFIFLRSSWVHCYLPSACIICCKRCWRVPQLLQPAKESAPFTRRSATGDIQCNRIIFFLFRHTMLRVYAERRTSSLTSYNNATSCRWHASISVQAAEVGLHICCYRLSTWLAGYNRTSRNCLPLSMWTWKEVRVWRLDPARRIPKFLGEVAWLVAIVGITYPGHTPEACIFIHFFNVHIVW